MRGATHKRSIAGEAMRFRTCLGVCSGRRCAGGRCGGSLAVLGARCGRAFGTQRARRGKQEALTESYVIIEQINHRAFALDTFGNEVDSKPCEHVGQIGCVNVGG